MLTDEGTSHKTSWWCHPPQRHYERLYNEGLASDGVW